MVETIEIKQLNEAMCQDNLLDTFNRYQKTTHEWQKQENGQWILMESPFEEDWDRATKHNKVEQFRSCIQKGGYVTLAEQEGKVIGFVVVESHLFGSEKQYVNLEYLHVSAEVRHQGVGKQLFKEAIKYGQALGAKKLYISSNPAETSQAFYRYMGCVWATEESSYYVERASYDCQLEYVL